LNDGTRGLIDKEKLSYMKQTAILINEARGAVVVERDVAQAIKDGKIARFGCDVYSEEPFGETHPYAEIMNFDNVILTPHAAWGAYEARERCVNIIAKNRRKKDESILL
jgi:glycerate dehydrogenase